MNDQLRRLGGSEDVSLPGGAVSMVHRFRAATVMTLTALFTGRGTGSTQPEPEVRLRTDANAYTAELIGGSGVYAVYGFTVVADVTNEEDEAVILQRCESGAAPPKYTVDVGVIGDDLQAAYAPSQFCVGHEEHFVLAPGETRRDVPNRVLPPRVSGSEPLRVRAHRAGVRLVE